ncbi:HAMP domain-containing sensor histidine kinase [Verrucomicrobiaceae bacterium 227]
MPSRHSKSGFKGGLFRQFILTQLIITILIAVMVLFWAGHIRRSEDRAQLQTTAESIAELTNQMNLPSSSLMARSLSTTTGFEVVFVAGDQIRAASPLSPSRQAAARLASRKTKTLTLSGDSEAVAFPLQEAGVTLVALQDHRPLFSYATGGVIWPLGGGLLVAIASAFIISRSIVWPLRRLAHHLQGQNSSTPLQLPSNLTTRTDEIGFLSTALQEERLELLSEQEVRRKSEHMALLGHLATGLAHEIKNPAAAILMHARTTKSEAGSLIMDEADHIVSLVNQWLFVAKPEPPVKKQYDLAILLRDLQEKLTPVLEFHRIQLVLRSPDSLPLLCDSLRLKQVFRNLIDNSIQAMPGGGIITIQLERIQDEIRFKIEDEGSGFSDNALSHFGETFYSEREGGMGLGLSLVTGVIQAHGGRVAASNSPNGSAQITGSLPAKI